MTDRREVADERRGSAWLREVDQWVTRPVIAGLLLSAAALAFFVVRPGPSQAAWVIYNVLLSLAAGAFAAALMGLIAMRRGNRWRGAALQAGGAATAFAVVFARMPSFADLPGPSDAPPNLRVIAMHVVNIDEEWSTEMLAALGYRWGAWSPIATLEALLERAVQDPAAAQVFASRYRAGLGRNQLSPFMRFPRTQEVGRYNLLHFAVRTIPPGNEALSVGLNVSPSPGTLRQRLGRSLYEAAEEREALQAFENRFNENLAAHTVETVPGALTIEELQRRIAARELAAGHLVRIETTAAGENRLHFSGRYRRRDDLRAATVLSIVGEPTARPGYNLAWSGEVYVSGTLRQVAAYQPR